MFNTVDPIVSAGILCEMCRILALTGRSCPLGRPRFQCNNGTQSQHWCGGHPRARQARTGICRLPLGIAATSLSTSNEAEPILLTHSQSGGLGWRTAIKSENVRAIVTYEPGTNFIFPGGEVPPPMPSSAGPFTAIGAPLSEIMLLTKIRICIFYGDNIPETPTANPGQDMWRTRIAME